MQPDWWSTAMEWNTCLIFLIMPWCLYDIAHAVDSSDYISRKSDCKFNVGLIKLIYLVDTWLIPNTQLIVSHFNQWMSLVDLLVYKCGFATLRIEAAHFHVKSQLFIHPNAKLKQTVMGFFVHEAWTHFATCLLPTWSTIYLLNTLPNRSFICGTQIKGSMGNSGNLF